MADDAVDAILGRIAGRLEDVSRRMVELYRDEIVDYRLLDEELLYHDVLDISRDNLRALVANVRRGELMGPEELETAREGAARRVHQGVTMEALLHAYRLWGRCVWEEILAEARPGDSAEREAALELGGRVMRHIDHVSTAAAQAYHDEAQGLASDREVLRRDLLDMLLAGKGAGEPARRQASSLRLDLREDYVVILAVAAEADDPAATPLAARAAMRRLLDTAKTYLRPSSGSLLVGSRQGQTVLLFPVEGPGDVERVKRQCARFAEAVAASKVCLGIGGLHPGLAGIPAGWGEAREAADVAARDRAYGRAVHFDEVLVDHILRSSPHADRVVAETIGPLQAYDRARNAELLATLRAYFDAGFNLTRSAASLCVHPNTVVYRLKRVRELTGRDPHDPDDLLLLSLGLKLHDEVVEQPA